MFEDIRKLIEAAQHETFRQPSKMNALFYWHISQKINKAISGELTNTGRKSALVLGTLLLTWMAARLFRQLSEQEK